MRSTTALILMIVSCAVTSGHAQAQDTAEARLRELLRRSAVDLRAAQEGQAALQSSLDQEKQQTAALKRQVDDLAAAQVSQSAAAKEQIAKLQTDLQAAQAQMTVLQTSLTQWQNAHKQAVDVARAKDAEAKAATARAVESERQAGVCSATNTKLITVANDILHMYQSLDFRKLLLASYEPLLGLKKVELENTIQDYEDKILDQKYRPVDVSAKAGAPK